MMTDARLKEIEADFANSGWSFNEFHLREHVGSLIAETHRLRISLAGRDKAIALLNAGMESQAEIGDGLKQENRRLKALLAVRDADVLALVEKTAKTIMDGLTVANAKLPCVSAIPDPRLTVGPQILREDLDPKTFLR